MNTVSVNVACQGQERPFWYRENSIGDKGVLQQIFVNGDYVISHWPQGRRLLEYHQQYAHQQASLIVDAGANIGASAVFFAQTYENAIVFAIEPDEMNGRLLTLNTQSLACVVFHGAIAAEDGELDLVDPGRSDWGFMTARVDSPLSSHHQKIPSICPQSILNHPQVRHARPLIFKIDIEGGEENLFSTNTDWLKEFPLVIIELHDWMLPFSGSSRNFLKAIAQYDFDLVHRGENIFLFNRALLKSL